MQKVLVPGSWSAAVLSLFPANNVLEFGFWPIYAKASVDKCLEPGIGNSEFGAWNLVLGIWSTYAKAPVDKAWNFKFAASKLLTSTIPQYSS